MIDLDAIDRDMVMHCLTPRQVHLRAQQAAEHGDDRDALAYLVDTACNLAAMACKIAQAYAEDSFNTAAATQAGLAPYRHEVLAAAGTCAHNAALFIQEAQRRHARRASGYDPLIVPQMT
ncbi:hypothetical protein [Actinoplanes sp. NPDC023714]|uniref:hypothetical protein n=1 Tax=Actinoplanes sp. NPDC023714 TaxID=3154322 RepID=UPI0033D98C68